LTYKSGKIAIPKGADQRRLQKAFLRYHDPANWPIIREALRRMRKPHLIGGSVSALIPDEKGEAALTKQNTAGARNTPRAGAKKMGASPRNAARPQSPNPRATGAQDRHSQKPTNGFNQKAGSKTSSTEKPNAKSQRAFGDKFESARKFPPPKPKR